MRHGQKFFGAVLMIVALAITPLLSACAPSGVDSPITNSNFTETPSDNPSGASGAAAAADQVFAAHAAGAPANKDEYRIAPLDVLDVSVYGVEDLTKTVQVSSSGVISLPLVRTVKAAGQTPQQLEQSIATKLAANYMQSPQVSVFVKEYNSQRITVDGEVNKPGIFPTTGKVTLMQSIAMAQGLTLVADPSGVIVFRNKDNKRLAARFDLQKVRAGQIPDPQLLAGDIVMVDASRGKTMLRDVKNLLPLTGLFSFIP
jgi:polysaccharide export outer membrane protein